MCIMAVRARVCVRGTQQVGKCLKVYETVNSVFVLTINIQKILLKTDAESVELFTELSTQKQGSGTINILLH